MTTNAQIRRLIAADRDALIALMAAAFCDGRYADGGRRYTAEWRAEPDILALIDDVRATAGIPAGERWILDIMYAERAAR